MIDRDKGYRKTVEAIRALRDVRAVVGIRQAKGSERYHAEGEPGARVAMPGGPLTLVEIATVNEFGTDDGRIPERPAFRDTFDSFRGKYDRMVKAGITEATRNMAHIEAGLLRAIEVTAIECVADIQVSISEPGRYKPNAPATIKAKGSAQPLIDTGRLRQSIDYAIVKKGEEP